jgi:hypothetical protein
MARRKERQDKDRGGCNSINDKGDDRVTIISCPSHPLYVIQ